MTYTEVSTMRKQAGGASLGARLGKKLGPMLTRKPLPPYPIRAFTGWRRWLTWPTIGLGWYLTNKASKLHDAAKFMEDVDKQRASQAVNRFRDFTPKELDAMGLDQNYNRFIEPEKVK